MLRGLVAGTARASVGPSACESVSSVRSGRVSFAPNGRPVGLRVETPRLARAIAVASGKGGVGKSNIALDLGCANADVLCGLTVKATLEDVLNGRRRLAEIVIKVPGIRGKGGLGLIPGASGVAELAALNAVQRQGLVEQLSALEQVVDLVIIDVGAGIGADAIGFACAADSVLLTCTPEPTAMTDAYATAKAIVTRDSRADLSLVVNMVGCDEEGLAVHKRMDAVARRHLGRSIPLAGVVPFDFSVVAAVKRRRPLSLMAGDTAAAVAIRGLAHTLLDGDARSSAIPQTERGFLSGVLRAFRRS
jgi:flagellar biosynthesis protein FlhG